MTEDEAERLADTAISTPGPVRTEAILKLVIASNGGCGHASAAIVRCLVSEDVGVGDKYFDCFSRRVQRQSQRLGEVAP